jgi:hypothetical protein
VSNKNRKSSEKMKNKNKIENLINLTDITFDKHDNDTHK